MTIQIRTGTLFILAAASVIGLLLAGPLAHAEPTVLFADNFDRPDVTVTGTGVSADGDINGTNEGKSGALGTLTWTARAFASNTFGVESGALTQFTGSAGLNGGLAYINDHNFTDPMIASAGGFSITVDIVSYATAGSGRRWAIGVGQSLADLDGLTANDNVDCFAIPTADLVVAYRNTTDDLEIWNNGVLNVAETVTSGLPNPPTTMRIDYAFSDFNAGSTVTYGVFFDDSATPFTSGSFTWEVTGQNYISVGNNLTSTSKLDNFQITADVALSPAITSISESGADLALSWESQAGKLYDILGTTDPLADPQVWTPLVSDIATTPPENTESFTKPVDPFTAFAVLEKPLPPLFSDDFEADLGWTVGVDGGTDTDWVRGTPSVVGPAAANSPVTCYGTNIDAAYGLDANISLRSPAIDLSAATAATLTFQQFYDIEATFDAGAVRVLKSSDLTQLGADVVNPVDGTVTAWTEFTGALPAEALGETIILEFRFTSDGFAPSAQAGWYIDDVSVTAE